MSPPADRDGSQGRGLEESWNEEDFAPGTSDAPPSPVPLPSRLAPSVSHSHAAQWDAWENIFQNKFQSHYLTQTTRFGGPALSANATALSLFRLRF